MRFALVFVVATACYQDVALPGDGPGADSGAPGAAVIALGVGARFACALDGSAQLACWGDNSAGELGIGTSAPDATGAPTVIAPGAVWSAVAVGAAHACGISDGIVSCWGDDSSGQLGTSNAASTPTQVPGPIGVDAIAAGAAETCGLAGSALTCWGALAPGLMATPTSIPGTWTSVSVGETHACGITSANTVDCWGACLDGECGSALAAGSGSDAPVLYQLSISAATPARVVAGDRETCVIDVDGHLACAGSDADPGATDTDSRLWTGLALGPTLAPAGSAGSPASELELRCGVADGSAVCWGIDELGGLGDGTWLHPGGVAFADAVVVGSASHVALGLEPVGDPVDFDEGGCLLAGSGAACWGDNRSGELATAPTMQPATAVAVAGYTSWGTIASSSTHTCGVAITSSGDQQLYCWGQDDLGEVTSDPNTCRDQICDAPQVAPVTGPIDHLVVGEGFTCIDRSSGGMQCWGDNSHGQLGDPSVKGNGPSQLSNLNSLVGGGNMACAVRDFVGEQCWGWYEPGKANMAVTTPTTLSSMDSLGFGPQAIVFAFDSQCDLPNNDPSCWGSDGDDQLGDKGGASTESPQALGVQTEAIAGSSRHYCIVDSKANVACWGSSADFESGQPTTSGSVSSPSAISEQTGGLAGCTSVATGNDFGCAVCGQTPWCWGRAAFGALGSIPPQPDTSIAIEVPGAVGVAAVVAGGANRSDHACAEGSGSGALACWGIGPRGELGTGVRGSARPVGVAVP